MDIKLLPADLIFCHGDAWLSKAIRWFERGAGEDESYANHTAIVGFENDVIEALVHVVETPFDEWVKANSDFKVYRCTTLTDEDRVIVAEYAEGLVGKNYGFLKLIPHALDGFLQKVLGGQIYLFRRLCLLENYPNCSWAAGWSYLQIMMELGAPARYADPDTQEDYVKIHKDWELFYQLPEEDGP